MKTDEIQRRLDVMVSAMVGKGKAMPTVYLSLNGMAEPSLSLGWKKRGARNDYDKDYTGLRGSDIGPLLANAEQVIQDLPALADELLAEFTTQLAATIEMGRGIGINAEFINPLTEAMKRLSENAITYVSDEELGKV